MLNKFKNPLILFLTLEKTKPLIFTSEINSSNSYFLYLNHNWFYLINIILKKDILFNKNLLIDVSCYNNLNLNNILIIFYNYYFLNLKLKLTILLKYSVKDKYKSIDMLKSNANWLERECSEMFGVKYINKSDIRKLLLDYSIKENPMLKNYKIINKEEYFYNYFNNQVNLFNCSKLKD